MKHRKRVGRNWWNPTMTRRQKLWRTLLNGRQSLCVLCAAGKAETSCVWWTPLMEGIAERNRERDAGYQELCAGGLGHQAVMAVGRPQGSDPLPVAERLRGDR
jgi:hypothetical protein